MLIGKSSNISSSEITSKSDYKDYFNRRRFLKTAAAASAAVLGAERLANVIDPRITAHAGTKLQTVKSPLTTTGEELTSYDGITH